MFEKVVGILIAGAASSILLALAHAYDWQRVFRAKVEPPWSYVAGVICLGIPFSALMIVWGHWWCLTAAAVIAIGGGLSVVFGYKVRRDEKKKPREIVYSELLDDERQISQMLRRTIIEHEQDKARLIAKLCALEADGAAEDPD